MAIEKRTQTFGLQPEYYSIVPAPDSIFYSCALELRLKKAPANDACQYNLVGCNCDDQKAWAAAEPTPRDQVNYSTKLRGATSSTQTIICLLWQRSRIMGSRTKDPGETVPYPSALLCACADRQGWRLPGRYEGIFIAIPSPWTSSRHPSAPDSFRVPLGRT